MRIGGGNEALIQFAVETFPCCLSISLSCLWGPIVPSGQCDFGLGESKLLHMNSLLHTFNAIPSFLWAVAKTYHGMGAWCTKISKSTIFCWSLGHVLPIIITVRTFQSKLNSDPGAPSTAKHANQRLMNSANFIVRRCLHETLIIRGKQREGSSILLKENKLSMSKHERQR